MRSLSSNPVTCFDFTISKEHITFEDLIKWLKEYCKKYCFQLEQGESGYEHYQGRISLKTKRRAPPDFPTNQIHWSVTSNENRENTFYVTKNETRIGGPWTDTDAYIPKQVRNITLYPWQEHIINDADNWDTRHINIVVCPEGNIGKSTLATYAGCRGLARNVPIMENYKDLMRYVMNVPISRLYLIDFPRSLNKTSSHSFWSAIETIKNGYCWDDRYEFKEKYFDCPNIWVFVNTEVNQKYLSKDRWVIWDTMKDHEGNIHITKRLPCLL